jgi:hypothetical protein
MNIAFILIICLMIVSVLLMSKGEAGLHSSPESKIDSEKPERKKRMLNDQLAGGLVKSAFHRARERRRILIGLLILAVAVGAPFAQTAARNRSCNQSLASLKAEKRAFVSGKFGESFLLTCEETGNVYTSRMLTEVLYSASASYSESSSVQSLVSDLSDSAGANTADILRRIDDLELKFILYR